MPKYSTIANKTKTSLSIDKEMLIKARKEGINISNLLDEALIRLFNPDSDKAYNKAIALQNISYKMYIKRKGLEGNYDNFKFDGGEKDVLEKDKPEDRSNKRSVEEI